MNYPQLKTLLETPEFASLDAVAAAQKLNEATITKWLEPPKAEIENFYRNSGFSEKISRFITILDSRVARGTLDWDAPENENLLNLYVAAKEVKGFFSGSIASMNGQNAKTGAAIAGFVQAETLTKFTQADADAFFGFFKYQISIAEDLFGETLTPQHVEGARRYDEVLALKADILELCDQRDQLLQAIFTKTEMVQQLAPGEVV